MSPLRRHGGGRPRSADSALDIAERWGISERAARRLAGRKLNDDALAILVADSRRYSAVQRREVAVQGRYTGGMRALGMRSRVPARHLPAGNSRLPEGSYLPAGNSRLPAGNSRLPAGSYLPEGSYLPAGSL